MRLYLLVLIALSSSGCLELEQRIRLKKDMSGKVSLNFSADMEPVVYFMAFMQKAMLGGGEGVEVSDHDLKAARKLFLEKQKAGEGKPSKEKLVKTLPPGVTLKKFDVKESGTSMSAKAILAFDHLKKLSSINMSGDVVGGGEKSPLSDLVFEEDAHSFTLSTQYKNPMSGGGVPGLDGGPENMPGKMGAVMKKALNRLSFQMTIESPFTVLEHNATRQNGSSLTWRFDYKTFKKMSADGSGALVRVKYRK